MTRLARAGLRWSPWSPLGGGLWLAGTVVGAATCALGWLRAADAVDVDGQSTPVDLAVAGAVILCASSAAWLRHGRRAVREQQARAFERIDLLVDHGADDILGSRAGSEHAPVALVMAPNGLRYHRGECAFVLGRSVVPVDPTSSTAATIKRCEVCRP